MTVRELENEFLLGQKYSIEYHFNDVVLCKDFVCGKSRCMYMDKTIAYIRTIHDSICIVIREFSEGDSYV